MKIEIREKVSPMFMRVASVPEDIIGNEEVPTSWVVHHLINEHLVHNFGIFIYRLTSHDTRFKYSINRLAGCSHKEASKGLPFIGKAISGLPEDEQRKRMMHVWKGMHREHILSNSLSEKLQRLFGKDTAVLPEHIDELCRPDISYLHSVVQDFTNGEMSPELVIGHLTHAIEEIKKA